MVTVFVLLTDCKYNDFVRNRFHLGADNDLQQMEIKFISNCFALLEGRGLIYDVLRFKILFYSVF